MLIRLAWRSIWRNKRRTIINILSIGLGLTFALFFITLADGAYYQMIRDSIRMQAGHITLEHKEYRHAPAIELYIEDPGHIREERVCRRQSIHALQDPNYQADGQSTQAEQ